MSNDDAPPSSADGDADAPARTTDTAETNSPPYGDAGPSAPALPARIRGASFAARPGRRVPPPAGPEVLRRVLDGLNRL